MRASAELRSGFGLKTALPWQVKIAAKLLLARLPVEYAYWRKLGLFLHGEMAKPQYAYGVFKQHFDRAALPRRSGGFVGMEIGPGDSLFSALVAYAFGATEVYLADAGDYARRDLESYQAMHRFLLECGLPTADISGCDSVKEILAACNARYLTSGVESLKSLPNEAIDFVWSHAVLEHIRRSEFVEFLHQLRRVLRRDGVCSHRIDLMDHLGGALNNLRFSERLWESDLVANSGFYTNRIRFSEMLKLFERAGFAVEVLHMNRWKQLPTPRSKLASEFTGFSDDDLSISGFDVLLRLA